MYRSKLKWLSIDSENKSHFNIKSHYSLHLSRHIGYRINNNSHILRAQGSSTHISWCTSKVPAFKLNKNAQSNNKKSNRGRKGEKEVHSWKSQISDLHRCWWVCCCCCRRFLPFFFPLWKEIYSITNNYIVLYFKSYFSSYFKKWKENQQNWNLLQYSHVIFHYFLELLTDSVFQSSKLFMPTTFLR